MWREQFQEFEGKKFRKISPSSEQFKMNLPDLAVQSVTLLCLRKVLGSNLGTKANYLLSTAS
jgi:hypothetical protein